jgi:hypothetical protein
MRHIAGGRQVPAACFAGGEAGWSLEKQPPFFIIFKSFYSDLNFKLPIMFLRILPIFSVSKFYF